MKKIFFFIILLVFLSGCSTMNRTPLGSKNIQLPLTDNKGNLLSETFIATDIGFGFDDSTKAVKIYKLDRFGNVMFEEGLPIIDRVEYYQLTKGGTYGLVAVQTINAAAMATTFGVIGRGCSGCGSSGRSGPTYINHNEASSFSDAAVDSVTDVTVGCSTGSC